MLKRPSGEWCYRTKRDTIECRIRHRDGHYIPVLVRGLVSRDDAGNAVA